MKLSEEQMAHNRLNRLTQETLEEAAEKYAESKSSNFRNTHIRDFKEGAKFQAERMYSEEDMAESFVACWKSNVPHGIECKVSFIEWFEQFKKQNNER